MNNVIPSKEVNTSKIKYSFFPLKNLEMVDQTGTQVQFIKFRTKDTKVLVKFCYLMFV